MKIHEYQAKEILKENGVPIQDGFVVENEADIESTIDKVAKEFNCSQFVVKAQIHAGGRGLGGGVKFCPDKSSAIEKSKEILGMTLKTHQTGPEGQLVRKIYITEALDIEKEYYVAITLDRTQSKHVIMASAEGGVDIEEVAAKNPEKIIKVWVDPNLGFQANQARQLAFRLGFEGDSFKQAVKIFKSLYKAYEVSDASIAEINPLVLTEQGNVIALDAKFNFDSNALYRQKDVASLRDTHEEDPTEVEADEFNLNYIKPVSYTNLTLPTIYSV